MPAPAKKVLESIARANSSPFISVQNIAVGQHSDGTLSIHTPGHRYSHVELSLRGEFQKDNAAAALAALEQITGRGIRFTDKAVRTGLAHVERLTGLGARMQVIGRRPLVLCDVAHNPDAARMLAASVGMIARRELHLIVGVMKDKDYHPMIRTFGTLRPRFYAVEASIDRSLPARQLQRAIREEGFEAERHASIAEALRAAKRRAAPDDLILITGSHYVVGEALASLRRGGAAPRKN